MRSHCYNSTEQHSTVCLEDKADSAFRLLLKGAFQLLAFPLFSGRAAADATTGPGSAERDNHGAEHRNQDGGVARVWQTEGHLLQLVLGARSGRREQVLRPVHKAECDGPHTHGKAVHAVARPSRKLGMLGDDPLALLSVRTDAHWMKRRADV